MARVSQFAKDMGMTYNEANNLVKKGRKLKDGGSQILEKTMSEADEKKKKKKKTKTRQIKDVKPFMPNIDPGTPEVIRRPAPIVDKSKFNPEEFMKRPFMPAMKGEKIDPRMLVRRKEGGGFPDLTGDGKVTRADILKGRGVFKKGGTLKMKDGGQFRGCGAQVKGKKFKGIF
tara:strand:+ start:132 stop:650 length:519 start_codon:yes stop_codon:yes gene_type:complete